MASRALVDAARARLAELEAGFTVGKAKVEAMKARLFARLRAHFQRRDRLRLVIGYRRKYLESLVRQGGEEAGKIAQEYRQAGAQQEQEYAETAAALAETSWGRPHPLKRFVSSRSDGPMVAGAFKPRIIRKPGFVAERRLPRTRRSLVEGRRRAATRAICGAAPWLESPGYRHGIALR